MQERRITEGEILRASPISDVLLPLEDAKARLDIDSRTWPIGTMREEELKTLYEDELKTLSFSRVMTDFLAVMTPHILLIETSKGIQFELDGKVLDSPTVDRDPGLIIAGYIIDFTRIVDPQKVSYKEIVRAIFEAVDFLDQNKVPFSEKINMSWHWLLGRSFGIALAKPDPSLSKEEANRFRSTYIEVLQETQQGERAGDIFARGLAGIRVKEVGPRIP